VVNQLHVTQLALKVNKTDIAIKLGSRVLIDLMKSKFDHKVLARRSGSPRSREAKEILQIVDRKDEAQEPSSPSYDDLLAHQSQTLCFALVKAGRPQDAIIISNALRRKMEEGGDVSPDIVRCNQEFVSWAEEYEERKQAAERSHAAALSPGSRSRWSLRDQPCFEQTSSRSPSGTSERSYSQAILRSTQKLGRRGLSHEECGQLMKPDDYFIAAGAAQFEPGKEMSWAGNFFGDTYWQRHSSLRPSKEYERNNSNLLLTRPPFK